MCETLEVIHQTMGQIDLDGAQKNDLNAISDIAYDGLTFAERRPHAPDRSEALAEATPAL